MTRMLVGTLLLLGTPMLAQQSQTSNPIFPNAQVVPESTAQTDQSEQPLQDKAAGNVSKAIFNLFSTVTPV
jgi:hypothetical protein